VEINVNNGFVDIAAEGFDAGVRLGETLGQNMVAVRISPELRMAIVGSPAYFAARGAPGAPNDLAAHDCIGLRFPTHGGLAVWDLEKNGRALNVRVEPRLVVNDMRLQRLGALAGAGLAYIMRDYVEADLASGALVEVLGEWCPPFAGYHLYYPSRRQQSPALRVVVDALRYRS
jgi:DNA-binding transcriptional LysR family regulator